MMLSSGSSKKSNPDVWDTLDNPQGLMSRSMTMDDRSFFSASVRKDNFQAGPSLKRSVTFVDKLRLVSRLSFSLDDVLYRKHFGEKPVLVRRPTNLRFIEEEPINAHIDEAVVITDTFSTGAVLANMLYKMGYKVICLLSGELEGLLNMIPEGLDFSFAKTIVFDTHIEPTVAFEKVVAEIRSLPWPVKHILAGAETGVELADQLSEYLGLLSNGTTLTEARRNKYVMGETVRAAGVRAVKQLRATTWGEIGAFLDEWKPEPFKVIVKPMDSAGSDDVTLCHNVNEVQEAFGNIMGKVNCLGLVNKAVLVQEYLEGTEYVVDTVSRDGVHKVVALWEYDRRASNGAGFVNFGQKLLTSDEPFCKELITYAKRVLDALGIKHGPTHGEVKWCKGEPVLVEVGARCHGVEGAWQPVVKTVYGFDQLQATVDAYFFPEKFALLPDAVMERKAFGRLLFLQCNVEGLLMTINENMVTEIRNMASFVDMEIFLKVGRKVSKTIDCFTFGGIVKLTNTSSEGLIADYNRIREMENTGLFVCD
mmetsp:Transcript_2629/g.2785  ORF Transcript_2629/g.2785 Transcript_2629/m.2785 type:complete len:536 (+) Transcript_2629:26-1633(+)